MRPLRKMQTLKSNIDIENNVHAQVTVVSNIAQCILHQKAGTRTDS